MSSSIPRAAETQPEIAPPSAPKNPVTDELLEQLAAHLFDHCGLRHLEFDRHPGSAQILEFSALGDATKAVFRRAAAATVDSLQQLGYEFVQPAYGETHDLSTIARELENLRLHRKDARAILQLWKNRPRHLWIKAVEFFTTTADYLCQSGEVFVAIDVCQEGLRYFPHEIRLVQLKAWALAQSGATETARTLLRTLEHRQDHAAETLGLLARTWKDMAAAERDPVRKRELLTTAAEHYERGFAASVAMGRPDYYPAINCATLQLRLDQPARAKQWAQQAAALAGQESPRGLWAEATLAEAALILGNPADAERHYRNFAAGGSHRAMIASARRQATELLGPGPAAQKFLADCLPVPPVYVFASSLPSLEEPFAATVLCPWNTFDAAQVSALLARKCEVHLVLPYSLEHYGPSHLGLSPDGVTTWTQQAASITLAHPRGSNLTAELASLCAFLQLGRARRLSETWSTALCFLRPVSVSRGPQRVYDETMQALHDGEMTRATQLYSPRCIAFADVVGYGQLKEDQVACFQQTLLPQIAAYFRASPMPPAFVQTWGDAFYLGFDSVRAGGLGALSLRQYFSELPWKELGFEKPLKLRLALHTGPMLTASDPFSGGFYFTGTVVSRAARMEPLADEDQIFCSDAFAAVSSALRLKDFTLTFAGTYLLPKNSGEEPLFRLTAGPSDRPYAE